MTENEIQENNSSKSGWDLEDKKKIAAIVYPLIEMQKNYGKQIDAKLLMQGWELVLSDKYNGDQICYAVREYALRVGDDMPSPKNINDILDPPEKKISFAEYREAVKEQERNNWPMMSDAQGIIDLYRQQQTKESIKQGTPAVALIDQGNDFVDQDHVEKIINQTSKAFGVEYGTKKDLSEQAE